jgi:hypothetical protein
VKLFINDVPIFQIFFSNASPQNVVSSCKWARFTATEWTWKPIRRYFSPSTSFILHIHCFTPLWRVFLSYPPSFSSFRIPSHFIHIHILLLTFSDFSSSTLILFCLSRILPSLFFYLLFSLNIFFHIIQPLIFHTPPSPQPQYLLFIFSDLFPLPGSGPTVDKHWSRKCGSLDVSQPYRPPGPVTGAALPLLFTFNVTDNILVLLRYCISKQLYGKLKSRHIR